jgi:hypothetical protein
MMEARTAEPLFLLGCGRSGTTLLQRVLNSHGEVVLYGEHGGFLRGIAEAYFFAAESELIATEQWTTNRVCRDRAEVRAELRDPRLWPGWSNWYDRAALDQSYRSFVESLFRDPTARYWGFKEIRYGKQDRVIDFLRALYPTARLVFVVRNPLDVVASQWVAFAPRGAPESVARKWIMQNESFLQHSRLHPKKSTIVRYEDLIRPDSGRLESLLGWLDLGCTDRQREVLRMPEARASRLEQDARPPEELFSEREKENVEEMTREMARELGYC